MLRPLVLMLALTAAPAALAAVPVTSPSLPAPAVASSVVRYGLFGPVTVVRPAAVPTRAVIVFSPPSGIDTTTRAYATQLAAAGSLVLTVDLGRYLHTLEGLKETCSYPAGHVEELSHWMQRHVKLATYLRPYLVGIGGGADFVYALGVQAPAGTFSGMATLGWDDAFRLPRGFCKGDAGNATVAVRGGYAIGPVKPLPLPWTASRRPGAAMQDTAFLHDFDLAPLPPAGDGAVLAGTLDGLNRSVIHEGVAPKAPSIADLPLTEVAPQGRPDGRIAVLMTGDGGWAGLDRGIAAVLSQHGVRVIGMSSLEFFWHKKTPAEAADAVARIIAAYAARYPGARFTLIGYSFGASLVPVVYNRLPPAEKSRVNAGVMISPDDAAVFEIRVGDWFGGATHKDTLPLDPELAHPGVPMICLSGEAEGKDTYCDSLAKRGLARLIALPGGHHYQGDYARLGEAVLSALPR